MDTESTNPYANHERYPLVLPENDFNNNENFRLKYKIILFRLIVRDIFGVRSHFEKSPQQLAQKTGFVIPQSLAERNDLLLPGAKLAPYEEFLGTGMREALNLLPDSKKIIVNIRAQTGVEITKRKAATIALIANEIYNTENLNNLIANINKLFKVNKIYNDEGNAITLPGSLLADAYALTLECLASENT